MALSVGIILARVTLCILLVPTIISLITYFFSLHGSWLPTGFGIAAAMAYVSNIVFKLMKYRVVETDEQE